MDCFHTQTKRGFVNQFTIGIRTGGTGPGNQHEQWLHDRVNEVQPAEACIGFDQGRDYCQSGCFKVHVRGPATPFQ